MATEDSSQETKVNERGMVTLPADMRRRLDIQPGDRLRWRMVDEELEVEVVRQRHGAFEGFEPAPMGGDGAETHDLSGRER